MVNDGHYMSMALKLAAKGIGSVEPNPAVGCVIVKGGQVAGKGYHKKFGEPHAEVNALEDCKNLGVNPKGATMYVTLEPCCHQGKTPPCTNAIIEAGIKKVFIAMIDPSLHARGKGAAQLKEAEIEVGIGLCSAQAKLLNAPFIKFAETGKTWVVLKWAQSIEGKLAYADDKNQWISNEQSRKDAHRLRNRVQAILVGIGTVLADDPLLTARAGGKKELTRIVLDSHLRIPLESQLLKTAKKEPVIIVAYEGSVGTNSDKAQKIKSAGAEILTFGDLQGKSNLRFLLDEIAKRGISQLLVEGGPAVIASFLKENLADEICVYIAPKILAATGSASISDAFANLTKQLDLQNVEIKSLAEDVRITGLIAAF